MARLPALPIIRRDVTEGLSANQSYRQFTQTAHEQGLVGLRRQDYLRLYSETRAARDRGQLSIGAPRTSLPSADLISPRSTQRATGYGSWVMVYQRAKGETELIAQPWLIRSNELLTPEEAERRVGNAIAQNPYEYDRTLVGVGYLSTDQYTPGGG